jgi:enoyl-CoA hydratase/3-hydroxyacyl-CoA dehydrogenase
MAAGSIRVTMEVGADGVALITIANPPVNALHPILIAGLKDKYAEAARRDDVKAIVLTGQISHPPPPPSSSLRNSFSNYTKRYVSLTTAC